MEPLARPLYAQVRDALVARIADGEWKAGTALPSEFALAAELGVSQGTVRKALDSMAAANLVERQQGRGTYVREHTEARALFHFFPMQAEDGTPLRPVPERCTITMAEAPSGAARLLGTRRRKLWKIDRVRAINGRPAIVEQIYLDPGRFTQLRENTVLPNALYGFYQATAGVTVVTADDQLSAVSADDALAQALDIAPGTPLLFSRRRAFDLRNEPVELRLSWFDTTAQRYGVKLK
ncbi:GntR family transcriptional regulator [Oceanibium sediminis]|uniref:GntR family transcriptional regulator n=1 Tax=Oceanibium sediminis TaxID=2026339 RepID=UPI0018E56710|nr:GntR family transcriptional regulator [Oceanibium sediminis]